MLTRHAVPKRTLPAHCLAPPRTQAILRKCSAPHVRSLEVSRRLLTTKHEPRPWKSQAFRGLLDLRSKRNLATALDDHRSTPDIPFDNLPERLQSSAPTMPAPAFHLRPFDASYPLLLPETPGLLPRKHINIAGIPGDPEEMLPMFNACLQVGKVDRAEQILKRMVTQNVFAPSEMITVHNQYLRAKLEAIVANPSTNKAEDVHRWYELYINKRGLPRNAETIAYMIKASLLTTLGARLERLVQRYMDMVPGEAGLEVLHMSEILTDQDVAKVTELCPTYNLVQADIEDVQAVTEEDIEVAPEVEVPGNEQPPQVLSTPQKGSGLKTLKQTLSLFSELPDGSDISALKPDARREMQKRLERDCVMAAVERWRDDNQQLIKMGLNTSFATASLSSRLYDWHRALEAAIAEEIELTSSSEDAMPKTPEQLDRCTYGPFLRQSPPSRLAAVTILSVLSALAIQGAARGVPLSSILMHLSKIVEEDIIVQKQEKISAAAEKKKKERKLRARMNLSAGKAVPQKEVENSLLEPAKPPSHTSWPASVRSKVAAALLSALIRTAKINVVKEDETTKQLVSQLQPAFAHTSRLKRGKKIGMISANKVVVDLMRKEPHGNFLARHLPMVAEPEPWTKFNKGGFIESPSSLVRIKNGERDQKIYAEAALARGDMDQVLKGLHVLGKTAWRINRPVFDVMLEAWNSGEGIADIPELNPDISVPPEPPIGADPLERSIWIKKVKAAEGVKAGLHSVRCYINFQLEIARAFRDQTFYFPHNIDFRGRAYPVSPYLNHMGADNVRGIMSFATGKELGPNGLKWLKIHLANVFGYDKASLADREAFAMDNMDKIVESATDPLKGSRWWLQAEDPWQCLAACFELKAAYDLPDPAKHVSYLPVHQDGTCNGLQHYAALGGDIWGAKQVNLEPGEKPADVYTAVADLVKKDITSDLALGSIFAKAVQGKITRKVVKQTVMTNVYGVTFNGAKKQVLKQLDALYPDLTRETGIQAGALASYIATKIFKAMSSMFKGAHDIQYWLGEIGSRVCRALTPEQLNRIEDEVPKKLVGRRRTRTGTSQVFAQDMLDQLRSTIVWTTPLRMPVVQPYRKSGTRVVKTCLQNMALTIPEPSDPVNLRKQLQAFPPNFIHSLDASHMLLCALECEDQGLQFAAVHDSFWTHAADVDSMNGILREAFIRIHSEDVIKRLAVEFEARYKGSLYLVKMTKKSEVGKLIHAHRTKAGLSGREELLQEKQRLELLRSNNPDDVKKGQEMVTPASIFEQMAQDKKEAAIEKEDVEEFALGNIPASEETPLAAAEAAADAVAEEFDAQLDGAVDVVLEDVEDGETLSADDSELASDANAVFEHERRYAAGRNKAFSNAVVPKEPKNRPAREQKIQLWLPLSFPPVPEKGSFDVARLRDSKYFFS